ncbi:uL15 family ribosomal protein [Candidatus Woesearchaeota archaeon]|nr:uL15 family ribosomal protein [Nanoarchaeota archaeon]MCB9370915.1 uL15 family ribosomal protein [Candidatus Woesearchaeota archaeon]USN44016.1 MAG: uL15 family ribosomal protein [Candidatus Woesearchaeota archaeon]
MRGTNSHGGGHKKKRRGSGHRGGFGMAGTGARADTKKPTILKTIGKSYYGKRGFTSIGRKDANIISLSYIESSIALLEEKGFVAKEGDEKVLDTRLLKADKVLGSGQFTQKLTLVCKEISQKAREKVEAAGGKVKLLHGEEAPESEA